VKVPGGQQSRRLEDNGGHGRPPARGRAWWSTCVRVALTTACARGICSRRGARQAAGDLPGDPG